MEKNLVFRKGQDGSVTTSRMVAESFGKEHKHVVRDIDELIEKLQVIENQCSPKLEGHQQMFESYYEDIPQPNGGVKPAKRYLMNKDGFTLLVMGYTGQKALEFKLRYIAAFNKMEEFIKQGYLQQLQEAQRVVEKSMKEVNSRLEKMDNRMIFMEKRWKAIDKHASPLRKPLKPTYLTISEAIGEFSCSVCSIGVKEFYHCLRKLEHIEKKEDYYNRPRGAYASAEMIIAVNIKPEPEEADTEDQDFTLLLTPDFVKKVIEDVKLFEAYDSAFYSELIQVRNPNCIR